LLYNKYFTCIFIIPPNIPEIAPTYINTRDLYLYKLKFLTKFIELYGIRMFGIASAAAGVNNIAPDNLPLHLKYPHKKIEAFQECIEKCGFHITDDILEILWSEILDFDFVCENATPAVMEIFLRKNTRDFDHENLFEFLCHEGILSLVEWYLEKYGIVDANWGYNKAAEKGHLHVIEFLYSKNVPLHSVDVTSAAINGHMNIILWFQEKGVQCDIVSILKESAHNGHLEIVQWAYNILQNPIYTKDAINLASAKGKVDVVKWLCSIEGAYCTELAIDCAAGMGHYEVVKFLNENMNAKFTFSAIAWAKSEGHDWIVHYLCSGSKYLSLYASPHFEDFVTKYLKSEMNYGNPSGEGCEFYVEDGVVCSVQERIADIIMFCM
jgi:hypothetical protein